MMWSLRALGLVVLLGVLLSLSALSEPIELPTCAHRSAPDGSLHWQCTGEQLLSELTRTLSMFAEHLTAVLRNPPRNIQLLLYDYKQENTTMLIGKAYRVYKEQLMLPTSEDLMPWDFSYAGLGPVFFIDRQSPETVYFLEDPKKDPDCEVDWWLYWSYLNEEWQVHKRWPNIQQTFSETQPITQNIRECYYIPENSPYGNGLYYYLILMILQDPIDTTI
jgi:hypothetical protein